MNDPLANLQLYCAGVAGVGMLLLLLYFVWQGLKILWFFLSILWHANQALREKRDESWFENHYYCRACDEEWIDCWSCACDDECPVCGCAISPCKSVDFKDV